MSPEKRIGLLVLFFIAIIAVYAFLLDSSIGQ